MNILFTGSSETAEVILRLDLSSSAKYRQELLLLKGNFGVGTGHLSFKITGKSDERQPNDKVDTSRKYAQT